MSATTEQNTSSPINVEGLRLSCEVVALLNRLGYKLKDVDLLEVAALCSKVVEK